MGDDFKYFAQNQGGKNPEVPEAPTVVHKNPTPEDTEKRAEPEKKEEQAKVEGTRRRADLATDILDRRTKGAEQLIKELDLDKSPDRQKENVDAFTATLLVILIKLHGEGKNLKSTEELEEFFKKEENTALLASLTGIAGSAACMDKLREIFAQKQSTLSRYFIKKGELARIINVSSTAAEAGKALSERMQDSKIMARDRLELAVSGGRTVASLEVPAEEPQKGIVDKGIAFVKKLPPIVKAGLVVAGGLVAWKLISSLFKDAKEESKDSAVTESSWINKKTIAMAALATCAVGIFLGRDKLHSTIKDWFGIDLSSDNFVKFKDLLFAGKFSEAFDVFSDSAKSKPVYAKAAKAIEVEAPVLAMLGEVPYDKFSHEASESWTIGKSFLFDKLLPEFKIPFVYDAEKVKQSAAAEAKLAVLFRKHKKLLEGEKPRTVGEALEILDKKGAFGGAVVAAAPAEKKEEVKEDEREDEEVQHNEEGEKALKESFTAKNAPNVHRVLKEYPWWKRVWCPYDFAKNLGEAAYDDKVSIVVGTDKVALFDGYKWVTLTSAKVLVDTIGKVLQAPFSEDVRLTDAVSTYVEGAVPFIVLGAGWGAAAGFFKRTGALSGALRGAGSGAIMPVTVVRWHAGAARRAYVGAHVAKFGVKQLISPSEYMPEVWRQEADFFAKMFRRYHSLKLSLDQGSWRSLGDAPRKLLARLAFSKPKLAELAKKAAMDFAKAYNNARGLSSGSPGFVKIIGDENAWVAETEKAIEELSRMPKAAGAASAPSAFSDAEIDSKAADLKAQRASARGMDGFGHEKVDAMLRGHGITPGTSASERFMEKWDKEMGERVLRGEGIGDGNPEFAKMQRMSLVQELPNGNKVFRFRNMDIALSAAEATGAIEDVHQRCFEKWQAQATELLKVSDVRPVKVIKGAPPEYEYKIGDKWIKVEGTPGVPTTVEGLKAEFMRQFGNDPAAAEIAKGGQLMKYLSKLPILIKVLGHAATFAMIYHLETAKDKKKAVAETTVGFAAFLGGAKLAETKVGSHIKNPYMKIAVDFMGGIAAAWLGTAALGGVVNEYLLSFSGAHALSKESISFFEKLSGRHMLHVGGRFVAEKHLLKRIGLGKLESFLGKKVESQFMKKVATLAAKRGVKQVLSMLGWKGATTALLLADDATVVGVLDDIVALGMGIWMSKDIYDIVVAVRGAMKMKEQMEKRVGKPLASFTVKNQAARKALETQFKDELEENPGGSLEQIMMDSDLDENSLFAVIGSLPYVELEVRREGFNDSELWIIKNGETVGMRIVDLKGDIIAAVDDGDTELVEKAIEQKKAA